MTRPAHIAMVSIPAPGHVNPSLEIIRELAARGHRVTYANDPSFAGVVTAAGAEHVPYDSTLPAHDNAVAADDLAGQLALFLDDAIAMLPQLRAAYDADRPDLFLYDMTGYPARVLAENWGVPCAQLSPSAVAWEGYEDDVADQTEAIRADPRGAEYYRRASEWLAANGASETDSTRFIAWPPRGLALIPSVMQPNADRVDLDRYTFVGPCLPEPDLTAWTRPPGAGKVLLVSLGSAFTDRPDFYRACLTAFGDLPGWHVVLQIGKHVDEADLGELPANVEIHHWVPQPAILEQADAFVTHAGSGGINEALRAGVPMIAVPQAVDQFMNADLVAAAGLGVRLDDPTPEALRAALLDLTGDPGVASRLSATRRELREQGGTARAADLIEGMLGNAPVPVPDDRATGKR
ncbi:MULTISPECIES: macrolide family glycosyltransferase [Actinomadura]|uniref:Macrolide family glycosyltransferase n=1 Tax=Actinomadura yumaensis TaxID=111807 RepID=A0ABW2CPY8_9ACTN|nr:macrolide family glycosyltransferase [Actinomadura sp. J1-007]MWK37344.1 glycosyl transferase [Actinomadura sp. J1-007]